MRSSCIHVYIALFEFVPPGEGQEPVYTTFSKLRQQVATIAAALKAMGITKGDRVVGMCKLTG